MTFSVRAVSSMVAVRFLAVALLAAAGPSSEGASGSRPAEPHSTMPSVPPAKAEAEGVVQVSAAASLRDVLVHVTARFQEAYPKLQVRLNFGASNLLARQILEGAPADLFFSADGRAMDTLERAGKLTPGTRHDLWTNALVVVVPGNSKLAVHAAADLTSPAIERIAICDDAVPVGHYARTWLASKGELTKIESRIVRPDDARATLAMVETGAVDAGFVYATDAKEAKYAKVSFAVPEAETPGIVYPAALLAEGLNREGAKAFLAFVTSPPASYLFQGAGFGAAPRR